MNDNTEVFLNLVYLGLFGTVAIGLLVFSAFLLPFFLVGGGIAFSAWRYYHSPKYLEQKAKEHTHRLYQLAQAKFGRSYTKEEFGSAVYKRMHKGTPEDLDDELLSIALTLYDEEHFNALLPPPDICNSIEGAKYRDYLSAQMAKDNVQSSDIAITCIADALNGFIRCVPPIEERGIATVPITSFMGNVGEVLEDIILPFFQDDVRTAGLFKNLRETFARNQHDVSGVPYNEKDSPKLVMPRDYEGDDAPEVFLKHTHFLDLFTYPVPFTIPEKTRFEHQWILAGTGHGKTQTLQHMLVHDFEQVIEDKASVVVMDSHNKLIETITNLNLFAPGEPLHDKLIWIDPSDVEFPLSLNLFDAKLERSAQYSLRERENLLNNLIDMYEFVFRSLLSSEMTDRQSTLFQFVTRLMLQIPNSNIQTLVAFLGQNNLKGYEQYIEKLDPTAKGFFETDYKAGAYKDTQQQVRNRLYSILRSTTFDRMFSAKE